MPHQDAEKPMSLAGIPPSPAQPPVPHQGAENAGCPAPNPARAPQPRTTRPRKPRRELRDMTPAELERERCMLLAVAAKASNERQAFVLRQKAAAVDEELMRRRIAALLTHGPADGLPAAEASYHGPSDEPDENPRVEDPAPAPSRAREEPGPAQGIVRTPEAVDALCPPATHEEPVGSFEVLHESPAESSDAADQQEADAAQYDGPPIILAAPDAPHPPLSDAQLTAVVRRGLRAWVRPRYHLLIGQIDVRQEGRALTLIVDSYQPLTVVEQELVPRMEYVLRQERLDGMFTEVRVRRGAALVPTTNCPTWMTPQLWGALPIAVQAGLAGATVVGTTLYGATPYHTALLANDRSGAVAWLLHILSVEGLAVPSADAGPCYNELDSAPETAPGCTTATPANGPSGHAKTAIGKNTIAPAGGMKAGIQTR